MRNNQQNSRYNLVFGDLFQAINKFDGDVIIPHVVGNGSFFNVDSGFANILSKNYPIVKANYELTVSHKLGDCQFVDIDAKNKTKFIFVNMVAQNVNKKSSRKINYLALVKCMMQVNSFIRNKYASLDSNKVSICCPKFGCGASGGGNWNFISDLIEDVWGDFQVYVYTPRKN